MEFTSCLLLATSLCAFVYTIQLTYFDSIRSHTGTTARGNIIKRAKLLQIGPWVCLALSIVAVVIVPIRVNSSVQTCSEENSEVNPDIGGIGVLIGLFLPCVILLLVLLSGHFTAETSGAKELCMAQCASMFKGQIVHTYADTPQT